jgi:hypothetical protein
MAQDRYSTSQRYRQMALFSNNIAGQILCNLVSSVHDKVVISTIFQPVSVPTYNQYLLHYNQHIYRPYYDFFVHYTRIQP